MVQIEKRKLFKLALSVINYSEKLIFVNKSALIETGHLF